jgi:hypothetical protein
MESNQLKSKFTDQLLDLYQKVQLILADKLQAEKAKIEERLRRIKSVGGVVSRDRLVARTRLSFPNTRTLTTPRRFGQAGVNNLYG